MSGRHLMLGREYALDHEHNALNTIGRVGGRQPSLLDLIRQSDRLAVVLKKVLVNVENAVVVIQKGDFKRSARVGALGIANQNAKLS